MSELRDHPTLTLEAIQTSLESDGRCSVEAARNSFVRGREFAVMQLSILESQCIALRDLIDDTDEVLRRFAVVLEQGGTA